ncbi:MAG: hypothetical protein LWW85_04875 [Marinilabiliales bacterium]|nr:hypothetical protein [Marinilabiliales bacterium]
MRKFPENPSSITRIKRWMVCVALVLGCYPVLAQDGRDAITGSEPFDTTAIGQLRFAFSNLNFFRNYEFKKETVDGYTLTGAWIQPRLVYYPSADLRLELGAQVKTFNGRDEYKTYPWFTAIYQPTRSIQFRMGNLDMKRNHGLLDAVLNTEHPISDRPESGIEAMLNTDKVKSDLWIDWQKMIFPGDPYKERFAFGTTFEFKLADTRWMHLTLPMSFNGMHEGGEIDKAAGPAYTHLAVTEGLKFSRESRNELINNFLAEIFLLQCHYPKIESIFPKARGNALYVRAGFTSLLGNLLAGYWKGNRFYTPLGMPLYQNFVPGSAYQTLSKDLWTLSYFYSKTLGKASRFGFAFEMFYNPATEKISNAASLTLMINLSLLVRKTTPIF